MRTHQMLYTDVQAYTYADYLTWTDDQRRELIGGQIHELLPAPSSLHQQVSYELTAAFVRLLDTCDSDAGNCRLFYAPFDVRLPRAGTSGADAQIVDVVQPDLVVVCDQEKIDRKGCLGPPDLVVEILSPSSARRDLVEKYALYESSGVPEYWIVFPAEQLIDRHQRDEQGKYQRTGVFTAQDTLPTPIGGVIELRRVFLDGVSERE